MSINSNPGYETRLQKVSIPGGEELIIRSLLDHQQFHDPHGAAERLGICSASWPLFGLVWESSIYLAQSLLDRMPHDAARILEIGCGLALPTLVGRRHGLRITASDRHPLARSFLEYNARINNVDTVKYRHGQWGLTATPSLDDTGAELLSARYDLILGSDLLYERNAPVELADFIDDHAKPRAEIWIIDPNRGYRAAFTREMASHGFELIEQERIDASPADQADESYRGTLLRYARG